MDHIGRLLRSLGWTPQKPQRRAFERDKQAIERWIKTDWPWVKKILAVDSAPCFPCRERPDDDAARAEDAGTAGTNLVSLAAYPALSERLRRDCAECLPATGQAPAFFSASSGCQYKSHISLAVPQKPTPPAPLPGHPALGPVLGAPGQDHSVLHRQAPRLVVGVPATLRPRVEPRRERLELSENELDGG